MSTVLGSMQLTDAQFVALSDLIKRIAGINLHDGKKELVKSRLSKRLRQLGLGSFDAYIDYLAQDASSSELTAMLDAISTNLTSFFRENGHFQYLADVALPRLAAEAARSNRRRLRAWSAGCSTGEEPYTLAICLHEHLPDISRWDARILATDLSTRALATASAGLYDPDRVQQVPPALRNRYFTTVSRDGRRLYQVNASVRKCVTFARLNLMGPWSMCGPFDIIFCRNVMIYFDKPTQALLVERYWDLLSPGGLLFIGHSESLTGIKHRFQYVQPTIYQRP